MISLIASLGKNREIGKDKELLWRIPGDLSRFKSITMGHPIIMGRKTYESIGRPLAGRTNILITRDPSLSIENCFVARSLAEALTLADNAPGSDEIFVIGGGEIYKEAIKMADRLYLTLVDQSVEDADTFFPEYPEFTKVVSREEREFAGGTVVDMILEKE